MISYPQFARNNTYGIQAITQEQYESAIAASPMCKNMTASCRTIAAAKDPNGAGNNADVNKACKGAYDYCVKAMHDDYRKSGVSAKAPSTVTHFLTTKQRNEFDITGPANPQAFPPKWAAGYLNDAEVQQALGVPLNWTGQSVPVALGT